MNSYPDELLDDEHLAVMMDALGESDWRTAIAAFVAGADAELAVLRAIGAESVLLASHAHRLKGLCLNVGAMLMAELARQLETSRGDAAAALVDRLFAARTPTVDGLELAIRQRWG